MASTEALSGGIRQVEQTVPGVHVRQFVRCIGAKTWTQARADASLYLAILGYTIATILLLHATGTFDRAAYAVYLTPWAMNFLFTLPALAIIYDVAVVIHRFRTRRRLAFRRRFSVDRVARLLSGMAFLMVFVLFQGSYTSIKNALPIWEGGFRADPLLANVDAWLHLGVDPWRYLYAIGAHEWIRRVVEFNYDMVWFMICFGALFFVVTSPRAAQIRSRYIVAFMLVWIVCGNVLAGALLSAGPAFFGPVTGDVARFADQMAFMNAGVGDFTSAAHYQHYLWMLHEAGRAGFGSGISAFPSVHVGMITMNAFFLAEHSRRWGTAAFAYVALIIASSVYLAWHYAVDGYASFFVVATIYLALRKLMPAMTVAKTNPQRTP